MLILSAVDGRAGCFQFSAAVKHVAISCTLLLSIGSGGGCPCSLSRYSQAVSQGGCTFYQTRGFNIPRFFIPPVTSDYWLHFLSLVEDTKVVSSLGAFARDVLLACRHLSNRRMGMCSSFRLQCRSCLFEACPQPVTLPFYA